MSYQDFLNGYEKRERGEVARARFGSLTRPDENPWMAEFTAEGGLVCEVFDVGCVKPSGKGANPPPLKRMRLIPVGHTPVGQREGVTYFVGTTKEGVEKDEEKGQILMALGAVRDEDIPSFVGLSEAEAQALKDEVDVKFLTAEKKVWPSIPQNKAYSEAPNFKGKKIVVQIVPRENPKDGKTYYNPKFCAYNEE